jgi:hypothetical protein
MKSFYLFIACCLALPSLCSEAAKNSALMKQWAKEGK